MLLSSHLLMDTWVLFSYPSSHPMSFDGSIYFTYNSLIFKVIIDRYVVIAILLFIYIYICFLLLKHNSFCNTSLVVMNFIGLFFVKLFICLLILNDSFAGFSLGSSSPQHVPEIFLQRLQTEKTHFTSLLHSFSNSLVKML